MAQSGFFLNDGINTYFNAIITEAQSKQNQNIINSLSPKIIEWLNIQPSNIKNKYLEILKNNEDKISILQRFFGNAKIDKITNTSLNKTCKDVFYDEIINQLGRGEFLINWLIGGVLTNAKNYDIKDKYERLIEVKTPANKSKESLFYRFGGSREINIYSVNFSSDNGNVNFWEEIIHTLRLINKYFKDIYKLSTNKNFLDSLKYLKKRLNVIYSGAILNAEDIKQLNIFFKTANKFKLPKRGMYSRVTFRGGYAYKKDIVIDPIPEDELENKKSITIRFNNKKIDDDLTVGRLNDIYYIRHTEFENHLNLIPERILDENNYYLFFNNNKQIALVGKGNIIKNNLVLDHIEGGRIRLRIK